MLTSGDSSLLAVMGVAHSHGIPAALGAVQSLAKPWGNLFSFWLLGVLRFRGGQRAYQ